MFFINWLKILFHFHDYKTVHVKHYGCSVDGTFVLFKCKICNQLTTRMLAVTVTKDELNS